MTRLLRTSGERLVRQDGQSVLDWVSIRHQEFRRMIYATTPTFPCYFAAIAESHGQLRYSYVVDDELQQPAVAGTALEEYLVEHPTIGGRSALIVFVLAEAVRDYESTFWSLVRSLHLVDSVPWPDNVPIDPNDPRWTFCFAGRPIFIAGHAPHYHNRKSRHSAAGLLLVIQPRSNLTGIVGHGVTATRVRSRIRNSLRQYDLIDPSPDLGVYGEPNSREWRQYWLPDTNDTSRDKCPLTLAH